MITPEEIEEIKKIRDYVDSGREEMVTREQRQWVLDIFKREGIRIPMEIFDNAAKSGFDTTGIEVNYEHE